MMRLVERMNPQPLANAPRQLPDIIVSEKCLDQPPERSTERYMGPFLMLKEPALISV